MTDPKNDQNKDAELDDQQLDKVAGGDGSVDPTDSPYVKTGGRPGDSLEPQK